MQYKHVSLAVAGFAIACFALTNCSPGGSDNGAAAPALSRTAAAEHSTPTPTVLKPSDAAGAASVTSNKIVDDQMAPAS